MVADVEDLGQGNEDSCFGVKGFESFWKDLGLKLLA